MNTFISVYCNHRTQRAYQRIKRYLNNNVSHQMPIIIGIFLLLSIFGAIILADLGQGYLRFGDIVFHYNRLINAHYSLLHGHLPIFNTNVGYPKGIAVGGLYPFLTWLPFVALTFLFKRPLSIFYGSFVIIVFLRFLISYYSYYTYDHNRFHSFMFSLLYTTNASVFYWLFISEDIGASLATIFLPLVLFGYIALLRNSHWKMLLIGVVLVIYSHLITALLMIIFIILLFLLNINRFNLRKIIWSIVAGIIAILLTSPEWLMMLKLNSLNYITLPSGDGVKFGQGLFTQLGVSMPLIMMATAFSRHWKLSYFDKQLLIIGYFCFLINANFIGNTFAFVFPLIKHIQFSIRFCAIGYLIYPFLIMEYLRNWSRQQQIREHQSFMKFGIMTLLLLMPCFADFNSARKIETYKPVTHHFTANMIRNFASKSFRAKYLHNKIDNRELQLMTNRAYYMDYAPVQSTMQWKSFLSHTPNTFTGIKYTPTKSARIKATRDGLVIKCTQTLRNVQMPLVIYHGVNYQLLLNGHPLALNAINHKLTNNSQLLTLKYLRKGVTIVSLNHAEIK